MIYSFIWNIYLRADVFWAAIDFLTRIIPVSNVYIGWEMLFELSTCVQLGLVEVNYTLTKFSVLILVDIV